MARAAAPQRRMGSKKWRCCASRGIPGCRTALVAGRLGDAHTFQSASSSSPHHRHTGPDPLPHPERWADDRDRSVPVMETKASDCRPIRSASRPHRTSWAPGHARPTGTRAMHDAHPSDFAGRSGSSRRACPRSPRSTVRRGCRTDGSTIRGLRLHHRGRKRHDRLPPARDGAGVRPVCDDRGRRAGGRLERVRVAQATGDESGSATRYRPARAAPRTSSTHAPLCAAARAMLEAAARDRWKVRASGGGAKNHESSTVQPAAASDMARSRRPPPVSRFRPGRRCVSKIRRTLRYIGKGQLKLVDALDIATGKAQITASTPAGRHALRGGGPSSGPGRKAASLDDAEALKCRAC